VSAPAIPLLTSGALSFPANRALAAHVKVGKGRLIIVGSCNIFDDNYFKKEDNNALASGIFKILTEDIKLQSVDHDAPEYNDRVEVPDIESLADRLRSCLQDSEELPLDFTQLFDHNLFKFDTNLIPEAVKLYEKLNVKHEPLSLIPPQFDVPLPALQPAVFLPQMRELPPPNLELYDLDEHFASDKLRLAQLTNRCNDTHLEYYIKEAGDILSIASNVMDRYKAKDEKSTTTNTSSSSSSSSSSATAAPANPKSYTEVPASHVLDYIFRRLVAWKRTDSVPEMKLSQSQSMTDRFK